MKSGLLLLLMIMLSYPLHAIAKPSMVIAQDSWIAGPSPKNKKPSLVEKIRLLKKIKKYSNRKGESNITPKQKRQARWALILGLISFAFLFMPFAMFIAFPAAIGGLIFGIKSVDGNSNAQGIIGIVASSVALSIFLIVGIVWLSIALTGL